MAKSISMPVGGRTGRGASPFGRRLRANSLIVAILPSHFCSCHHPHVTARESISAEGACWTEMAVLSMDDHLCNWPWYAIHRIDHHVQGSSRLDFVRRNRGGPDRLFDYYPCHALSA